jgi:hypothetical protein
VADGAKPRDGRVATRPTARAERSGAREDVSTRVGEIAATVKQISGAGDDVAEVAGVMQVSSAFAAATEALDALCAGFKIVCWSHGSWLQHPQLRGARGSARVRLADGKLRSGPGAPAPQRDEDETLLASAERSEFTDRMHQTGRRIGRRNLRSDAQAYRLTLH